MEKTPLPQNAHQPPERPAELKQPAPGKRATPGTKGEDFHKAHPHLKRLPWPDNTYEIWFNDSLNTLIARFIDVHFDTPVSVHQHYDRVSQLLKTHFTGQKVYHILDLTGLHMSSSKEVGEAMGQRSKAVNEKFLIASIRYGGERSARQEFRTQRVQQRIAIPAYFCQTFEEAIAGIKALRSGDQNEVVKWLQDVQERHHYPPLV